MNLPFLAANWSSAHPMIVHFPIALLLAAPLFILIGAILAPPKGRPFLISALILLGLGTAGLFFAVPTGEAAAGFAARNDAVSATLQRHKSLAFETRGVFVLLLALYGAVLLPRAVLRRGRLSATVLPLAFLLFYCTGAALLLETAQHGNALVHTFGVHGAARASGHGDGAATPAARNALAPVPSPAMERKPQ